MAHSRRRLLQTAIVTGVALGVRRARAQSGAAPVTKSIGTPALNIAYEESGNPRDFPVILLHGFSDDVRARADVAPPLVKSGHRVLVPWLRGYGSTRFRDAAAPRMAEQAAIARISSIWPTPYSS